MGSELPLAIKLDPIGMIGRRMGVPELLRRLVDEINDAFAQLTGKFQILDDRLSWLDSTPAQITSNQNDYDHGNYTVLRLSSDASRNITGFLAGIQGQILVVLNVGSFPIVLTDQDANSAAANQMLLDSAANQTLTTYAAGVGRCILWYDTTVSKWRKVA